VVIRCDGKDTFLADKAFDLFVIVPNCSRIFTISAGFGGFSFVSTISKGLFLVRVDHHIDQFLKHNLSSFRRLGVRLLGLLSHGKKQQLRNTLIFTDSQGENALCISPSFQATLLICICNVVLVYKNGKIALQERLSKKSPSRFLGEMQKKMTSQNAPQSTI